MCEWVDFPVSQIRKIISANQWTQTETCKILDLNQPKLSNLLNGKFCGISEAKMLDCLIRVGRDVQIVIGSDRHGEPIAEYRLDLLVENSIIIELKAQQKLPLAAEAQLINYLKATGKELGLLVNFSFPKAVVKRVVL